MSLHVRQPAQFSADFEFLIRDALSPDTRPRLYRDRFKRLLDIALVLVAAIPVLLVLLPFCILVALDGASPIYRQKRVGLGGRVFNMWKLRSMVVDADARLEAHLAADPRARIEWTINQKLRHDPRITPIGHLIRKASIDELPQLWNVLRGDMSLVGPRPMMVSQRDIYPGTAYYALRPGITGYWQTSVRNLSSFSERARFDHAYLRDLSFGTDLAVMLRTVRVVLTGTGC
ncbi:sugar transferase [Roseivivax isoporae]|uniref:Sugar transferase n=1 Tax=Roseivivax isoporae LMG 25204 TaxID=1449351 RepID=X7F8Z5_9RHOB|nr:sugar transferase [Roseivivax isoporae]ETX28524.1 sugar transferase [Roseivivax isoporae LMG 25204]